MEGEGALLQAEVDPGSLRIRASAAHQFDHGTAKSS